MATGTADDAVHPESQNDKSKTAEAAERLKKFLATGEKPATECNEYLEQVGFIFEDKVRAAQHTRIKRKAEAESYQKNGLWWWRLKAPQGELPKDDPLNKPVTSEDLAAVNESPRRLKEKRSTEGDA